MNTATTKTGKNQAFISDLERVLDHFWEDERRDHEARNEADRGGHVFPAMQSVRRWLDENRAELLEDRSYNGWSNYETWAVNLWLSNTEEDYRYWRDAARYCLRASRAHHWVQRGLGTPREAARYMLSDRLRDEVADACIGGVLDLSADLFSAALSEVNWHEVADAFLEDLTGPGRSRSKAIEAE